MRNVAISLYDESGNMLRPWAERGWDCYNVDLIGTPRVEHFKRGGRMTWIQGDMTDAGLVDSLRVLRPSFISSFPPCTDLAVSGARHFAAKKKADPLYREKAMRLVYIARDLILETGAAGFIENPVSVISTEWRKRDFQFDPCDYGGYLPADDMHPRWPDYIAPRDAYTKATCIWALNGFFMPPTKKVEPIIYRDNAGNQSSKQWGKLGGKSAKTKQIRSETARGFALAVAEHVAPVLELRNLSR